MVLENDNDRQIITRALMALMSEISEECYCAGWMMGLEIALWNIVTGDKRNYGQSTVSDEDVLSMKVMSDALGGWIVWQEDSGEVFIPMAEWLSMYDEWHARNRR